MSSAMIPPTAAAADASTGHPATSATLHTAVDASPRKLRAPRPDWLMWAGLATFLAAFAVAAWQTGLPWSRDRMFFWIALGLLSVSLRNPRRWARGMVVDWLPVFGILFMYDLLRGYADTLLSSAHTFPQ